LIAKRFPSSQTPLGLPTPIALPLPQMNTLPHAPILPNKPCLYRTYPATVSRRFSQSKNPLPTSPTLAPEIQPKNKNSNTHANLHNNNNDTIKLLKMKFTPIASLNGMASLETTTVHTRKEPPQTPKLRE